MPAVALPSDLSASHDLLRALLDVSLPGIILFRPVYAADDPATIIDLAYVHLNPAAQQMLRLPAQPPETFRTLYPSALETGIFAFYREAFLSGQPREYAVNYPFEELNNFFQLTARRSGELLVVGFTDTAAQDRSQVEQALRASQAREQAARAEAERQRGELERVFEQAPVAIAVYRGASYTIELANPTVARLWGRTRAQLLGRGLFEALPEVAGLGYEELLAGVLATGIPYVAHAMAAQHEREGGLDTVYWDFVYVPMYGADETITGVMVVATEVTAQVRARQAIEQLNQELEARVQERTERAQMAQADAEAQRARLHNLLTQAPALMASLQGPTHVVELVNDHFQRLFGERQLVGKPYAEALFELVDQHFMAILDNVYRTGETFTAHEELIYLDHTNTGRPEPLYFDFIWQATRELDGRVSGILVFAFDVSAQVHARQGVEASHQHTQALAATLAETNQRLTRTNADLDTFVYTASHDLKAPITNIESILGALRDTLPAAVQQEEVVAHLMGLLDHTVDRFRTTIDQLTDLTRLQHTYNEPAELLLLAPVIAGVVQDLSPQLTAAQAELHLVVPADLRVSFAPASLRSIVYNLLSNAIKYHDPARPAQVWLQAEQQAGDVVLTVRDNGLGLTELQQQRLFGAFQRLHTHVEGTGVGLYMIKRLIDNAGARIAVTSTSGVGSIFTVTFSS